MSKVQQKRRTNKKHAAKPAAVASLAETATERVGAVLATMAERGRFAKKPCQASEQLERVCDALVGITDCVSEMLAGTSEDMKGERDTMLLNALNGKIWELRWQLGLHGGAVEGADPQSREHLAQCSHVAVAS